MPQPSYFPPNAFRKWDVTDDALFYEQPRFVTHIDDAAIAALTDLYREMLPAGGVILDLMSSWVSHLPPEVSYTEVVGHGMNTVELAANPRLNRYFIQDLNKTPKMPLADDAMDAVLICVSIQYLEQPIAVLSEAARVLKPGGCVIVSFSNRCFPTKAVAIWQALDDAGHVDLVSHYLTRAGFDRIEAKVLRDGSVSDPMFVAMGWTADR